MKLINHRFLLIIALIFGVVGFAGAFTLANGKQKDTGNHSHTSDKQHVIDAKTTVNTDLYVDLQADRAIPDALTVPVGKTVQFNSKDGKKHNLSLGLGGEEHEHAGPFHSGEFGANEAWRATFTKAGTYSFHDHNNPKINILIVAYLPNQQ